MQTDTPKIEQIADLLGVSVDASLDDYEADGIWFRVQPTGLGLDHRSTTSSDELADGPHVCQTLAQAVGQEGVWQMRRGHELVVISGPEDLADTGDVEGYVLPVGEGEIVGRFDFGMVLQELSE